MKRFYKTVTAESVDGGRAIRLDGRAVKTPARAELVLPTASLTHAVIAEWDAQADEIDPRSMPLTGLANAAIDRVAPDPKAFAATLAGYAETDLLCYRAERPDSLVERQAALWDPVLDWARRRFDIAFVLTAGVVHRPQPAQTVARLAQAVAALAPYQLAGLSPLVTVSGSLILALALAEGGIGLDEAWEAAAIDELWQAAQWGEDADAALSLEGRRADFAAGHRFLTLL